ncbi:hypothetical protein LQ327_10960 [Actinomycetospora endophytica]|uniref:Uncharacterized protein n=1 Tax=Actinomycetospora endophytica TaxID=2291215 RepID=A0ABS8P6Z6_9PSEU|nr:hypothetical protein [Actinomycetospora endophytica]MCD2193894.1 hypothetical protein [Actinomycetospora endophytica]
MIETGRLALDGDDSWDSGSWRTDAWRRGRDVLDGYGDDRVLSEELADELVNELAGLAVGSRRHRDATRPWRSALAGTGVEGRPRRRTRPHLTLVAGGMTD